mmetsp:Transcript_107708/g.246680  ORF Transcript_107708/g.246680 Transcript_107708/m.246680 type:complete len:97 (+) Transcript_107708:3165-3455(+)
MGGVCAPRTREFGGLQQLFQSAKSAKFLAGSRHPFEEQETVAQIIWFSMLWIGILQLRCWTLLVFGELACQAGSWGGGWYGWRCRRPPSVSSHNMT